MPGPGGKNWFPKCWSGTARESDLSRRLGPWLLRRKRAVTLHRPDAVGADGTFVMPASLPDVWARETGGQAGSTRLEAQVGLLKWQPAEARLHFQGSTSNGL